MQKRLNDVVRACFKDVDTHVVSVFHGPGKVWKVVVHCGRWRHSQATCRAYETWGKVCTSPEWRKFIILCHNNAAFCILGKYFTNSIDCEPITVCVVHQTVRMAKVRLKSWVLFSWWTLICFVFSHFCAWFYDFARHIPHLSAVR